MTAVLFITRYRVDRAQARIRYRKEFETWCIGLLLFPWFSSLGVITSDQS